MEDHPNTGIASERKLAAIMFTDIVGYTIMMQQNEEDGLKRVEHPFSSKIFKVIMVRSSSIMVMAHYPFSQVLMMQFHVP